jgi:two-component sensor histidine kinase
MNFSRLRRLALAPRSIRWHLGALCVLLLLPATVFFGLLLWQYAKSERAQLVQRGLDLAQDISEAVEQDLASLVGTARLAAASPRLQAGDIETSGTGARSIGRPLGVDFAIREPSGRQLMNTRMESSETYPNRTLDIDPVVLGTKQPAVSNLFRSVSTGQPSLAVVAPVVRSETGTVVYLLDIVIGPERVRDILLKEPLPQGVVATVLDRQGYVVARSRRHDDFIGSQATELLRNVHGREGYYEGTSLDGIPLLVYYTRLTGSDWIVAVGLEQQSLNAPIWRLILQLLTLGAVLALLSALLAYLFGRRISGAMERLSSSAAALGGGTKAFPVRSPIEEINRISATLLEASNERQRFEQSQALMVRELHHRVKNTLATVQAVVSSTARHARTIDELRETVTDRIASLARTHTLLVDNAWGGASLQTILEAELAAYDNSADERLRLKGPDVHVPDATALAIGMTVHELTTNAAKYGSLSAPHGRLEVHWSLKQRDTGQWLDLSWRERNGPPVQPPKHRGFGSQLIERVIVRQLGGEVRIEYAPDGLQADFALPLWFDVPAHKADGS